MQTIEYWYPPKWGINHLAFKNGTVMIKVFEGDTANEVWQMAVSEIRQREIY